MQTRGRRVGTACEEYRGGRWWRGWAGCGLKPYMCHSWPRSAVGARLLLRCPTDCTDITRAVFNTDATDLSLRPYHEKKIVFLSTSCNSLHHKNIIFGFTCNDMGKSRTIEHLRSYEGATLRDWARRWRPDIGKDGFGLYKKHGFPLAQVYRCRLCGGEICVLGDVRKAQLAANNRWRSDHPVCSALNNNHNLLQTRPPLV